MTHGIGFTGSREGITEAQAEKLDLVLSLNRLNTQADPFHHGDCVGADEAAHQIAKLLGFYIVVHPPIVNVYRAFCEGDETRQPHDYLIRNHNIVGETRFMIACPSTPEPVLRSGTWATVRAAQKDGKRALVILPSGKINWL
jgi:hypothetical protein